jgi:hypothetical protein
LDLPPHRRRPIVEHGNRQNAAVTLVADVSDQSAEDLPVGNQSEERQGRGSNEYLPPKTNPEGDEAAFGLPDNRKLIDAVSQSKIGL